MDYRENFVRAFDPSIIATFDILKMLESDVVDIQNVINENQKNLALLQLSHYVKFYFVGLFDNFSVIEKRMKDISEFRKLSQKLPFRVIVKILSYFAIRMTKKVKITDFYCYFSFDPFRKLFQVFTSSSYRGETPNFISSIHVSSYGNGLEIQKYLHNFSNLGQLEVGRGVTFPKNLHPESCRKIKTVHIDEFSHTRDVGLKSCKNLEELNISRLVDQPTSPVFVCTEFPKLRAISFYEIETLNRYWEFHKIKSLKELCIGNSNYSFERTEIVLLLSSCPNLEHLEFGRYNSGLEFPFAHLFFMYGYSLKKVDFYNLVCNNWYHLREFTPMNEYRMEQVSISNYEVEGQHVPVDLFHFACKHYAKTLKKFDLEFPTEGEEGVQSGVLGDLSPLTNLKELTGISVRRSLYQSDKKTIGPLSLDFCCEKLEDIYIQNYTGKLEEDLFLGLDPTKFVKLKEVSFENYVRGTSCKMDRTWISGCLMLPSLKKIRVHGELDAENWYELLMNPCLKTVTIERLKESMFDNYALTPEEAKTSEEDLRFSERFIIPENNCLKSITISRGASYPWSFVYEITRKCRHVKTLVLNEYVSFTQNREEEKEVEKFRKLEEKLCGMKIYIFKNMISMPKLEILNLNVPNSTMAKREFGRQNMFSFSISSDRFVQHREKELKILEKHRSKLINQKEETEGEEEEESEVNNNKKKNTKRINVMYRLFKTGGTLLTEKGKDLFSMSSMIRDEVEKRKEFFAHPIHAEEMKEINIIFRKIDTLQIMLLPKSILLKILNEFVELTVKSRHRALNVKKLFGYFRFDRERSIIRVFSSVHFIHVSELKMDEITQCCSFHSLRFDNAKPRNILEGYRPFGLPRNFKMKKGCLGKVERIKKKKKKKYGGLQREEEEEGEEGEEDENKEEETRKKKKDLYRRFFQRLESISLVDVMISKEFIEEMFNPEHGLIKRIRRLEFVYSKLKPEMLELFLRQKEDGGGDQDWSKLRKFKIVQYHIPPHVIERLKEKFGGAFEYSKVQGTSGKKRKKNRKNLKL